MVEKGLGLVINPWKIAFYLILLANIVFHCSPTFLLLIILFGVFGYAYFVLSEFFSGFVADYRQEVTGVLEARFLLVEKEMSRFQGLLTSLFGTTAFFLSINKIWGGDLLTYKCDNFPLNCNFLFIVLEPALLEEVFILQTGSYYLDYTSVTARVSFLESVLLKTDF